MASDETKFELGHVLAENTHRMSDALRHAHAATLIVSNRMKHTVILGCAAVALLLFVAVAPSVQAKSSRFGLVYGDSVDNQFTLNQNEAFAFAFGAAVSVVPNDLEHRQFLEIGFFESGRWPAFLADGGDVSRIPPVDADQRARLYFGTEHERPLLEYRVTNVRRYLGPHHLDILAARGIPKSLTDPHNRARLQDDPPQVKSGGVQILPIALPATGSGGLAGDTPTPTAWPTYALITTLVFVIGALVSVPVLSGRRRS